MVLTHDTIANEGKQPDDRIADDRAAQVTDVHLLGDVRCRVVDDVRARGIDGAHSEALVSHRR